MGLQNRKEWMPSKNRHLGTGDPQVSSLLEGSIVPVGGGPPDSLAGGGGVHQGGRPGAADAGGRDACKRTEFEGTDRLLPSLSVLRNPWGSRAGHDWQ